MKIAVMDQKTKYCKCCDSIKSIKEFGKNVSNSDGLQFYCKKCGYQKSKKYYNDNKDKMSSARSKRTKERILFQNEILEKLNGCKLCPSCKKDKLISEFGKNSNNKDGLQCYCKSCSREKSAKYRKDNRDHISELRKKSYNNNKEIRSEQSRKYHKNHRDKRLKHNREYYSNNKEKISKKQKEWRNNNKNYISLANRAREKLIKSGEKITQSQINELLLMFNFKCGYCGIDVKCGVNLHIDHRMPLVRGGEHAINNLIPACATCNLRKGSKTEEEFRQCL